MFKIYTQAITITITISITIPENIQIDLLKAYNTILNTKRFGTTFREYELVLIL